MNTHHHEPHPARGQRQGAGREAPGSPVRVLITAGPTHEPIDAVRFLGNRSSGRLGIALSDEAARRGCDVTLLLGPTPRHPTDSRVRVARFQTSADLEGLLARHLPLCDILIMAAAVADYRPRTPPGQLATKLKRQDGALVLELEPTRDQIAWCSEQRRPGQLLVGFALEPRERLLESARDKLRRKRIDLIVANPLETMDSDRIEATVLSPEGAEHGTPGMVSKTEFAPWLMDVIERAYAATARRAPETVAGQRVP